MSGWIVAVGIVVCSSLAMAMLRLRRQFLSASEVFDVLSRHAPIGIVRSDACGICTFANEEWCAISGVSPGETLGRHWERAVHPGDLEKVQAEAGEGVRDRSRRLSEVRVVRPDGSLRYVIFGIYPTRDERGVVTGSIGTALDVTGRRAAEREVREKDSLLRAIVDHSAAAIYLKDTVGRYLLANRHHTSLWPSMKEFRPGTTPFDWFPEEIARSFIETDAEVRRTGGTKTFEEVIAVGGELRTFLSVKFPVFDEDGRVTAIGGISADITELETSRRALAERERLLRRLIELQENEKQHVCHEFHDGLIQYAVGSKMLLEGLLAGELPYASRETVGSVVRLLARGIDDGRRVIRGIRPAALDDLGLRAAIEELAADLQEAGIEVEVDFDPAVDEIPPALQTTLYRIVQESFNNAREHSGSERVHVKVWQVADWIEVTIADWGRGFEPAVAESAGFGLTGIRERARLAGGQCVVESSSGKGTRITVRLPAGCLAPAASG